MRVIGSPDPYGKHTDGMGGATSSTSKTVIVSQSKQPGHDVDYLFGQVSIDKPFVDWSGNCGNLSAAVGPFAIQQGLLPAERIPENGFAEVRIWQVNIGKTIVNKVPISHGEVQETGSFELDGVTFPAAEIAVDFLDPADTDGSSLFPHGQLDRHLGCTRPRRFFSDLDQCRYSHNFFEGKDLGYRGTEMQDDINGSEDALKRFENIRAHGAVAMGLIDEPSEAAARQHTPKVAFVAPPCDYAASSGKHVEGSNIDLLVRALSMGKLHHAMMGTAAVAIGTSAAIPGTLVNLAAGGGPQSGGLWAPLGHPHGAQPPHSKMVNGKSLRRP